MLLPTALFLCASLVAAGSDQVKSASAGGDVRASNGFWGGNMGGGFPGDMGGGGFGGMPPPPPGFPGNFGGGDFGGGGFGAPGPFSVSSASTGKHVCASNGFWGGPGGDFGGGGFGDFGGGSFGGMPPPPPGFPGDFGGGGFGAPGLFSASSASAGKHVGASNGFWGSPGGDFGGGGFGDFGGGGFGGMPPPPPGFPGDFGGGGFGALGLFSASSASAGKHVRASNGFWGGPGGDFGGGGFGDFGGGMPPPPPGFPGGFPGDFGGGFGGLGPFSAGSADKSAKTVSYGGEKDKDCDEKDDYNKAGHRWHKRRTWYRRKKYGSKNQDGDSDCEDDKSNDGSSKY